MKHACFTGHRNFQNISIQEVKLALTQLIEIAITQHQIEHFYSGMAIGTDLLAANMLTTMDLSWTAVIPCLNQPDKWSRNWQKTYFSLLSQANSNIVLQTEYSSGCMNVRNAWMIKHSDLLIAVWNEKEIQGSGTYNTVKMAKKKGIPILLWNPETNRTKLLKPKKAIQVNVQLNLSINF